MKGIVASPGMALASAYVVTEPEISVQKRYVPDAEEEWERLQSALSECYSQIEGIMNDMDGAADSQTIEMLDFQLLLLEDTDFIGDIKGIAYGEGINAEYAVAEASGKYITKLENITDNDYLRERASDVADLSNRLIAVLSGINLEVTEPEGAYIAVGADIALSRLAGLDKGKLKGIILENGGITSHCVILSRSFGIPCLIKTTGVTDFIKQGDTILLDAMSGDVVQDPDAARIQAYHEYLYGETEKKASLDKYISCKSRTLDGVEMNVFANITKATEAQSVVEQGGEGVGLFRSELLYLAQKNAPPSEQTQYAEYSEAAKALGGRPLVIRTLDVGGDKQIGYLNIEKENNPFLGYRAIRYCIDHPEVFIPQISAILRAGNDGNVWMMFPMIACKTELLEAKRIVKQVGEDLRSKGIPYDSNMKIGMMMETPAAALNAAALAREADFFSIGTNDLSQYLFAADRESTRLTHLNSPFQPSLLRAVRLISAAAANAGIEVDICGQAAEIDALVPVWLAMGITNLSVSIPGITAVRKKICGLIKSDCKRLLDIVLQLETAEEVEHILVEYAERTTDK